MRTIATVVSLVALSAVGLQTAHAQSKPWSVSANLRGFYDDNIATTPSGALSPAGVKLRQASFGLELSPSISLTPKLDQTDLGLSYTYGMKYYENRSNSADHSHQAEASLKHEFTPRYKIAFKDSFVLAQEAGLLDPLAATLIRSDGNNIRNTVGLDFSAELTQLLTVEVGYDNTYYDYEQTGVGSRSALLDRVEHLGKLNLRWQALPTTVGILGYQFGIVDQTSKELLAPAGALPNTRDNRSQYFFAGADHDFNTQLRGSVRAGGQYTEFPDAVPPLRKSSIIPYADVNASYTYSEGSYVQLGVKHTRNQTDIGGSLDQEITVAYGALTHKITAKLTCNVIGQYNNGSFNGGASDGLVESTFLGGVNLAYTINQYLTAETGYNYDRLTSDVAGRSFSRNRVFLGIRATY